MLAILLALGKAAFDNVTVPTTFQPKSHVFEEKQGSAECLIGTLRIAVGIAQMTMALVTLGLYLDNGLDRWSIGALVVTILLVAGSRLTF